MAQFVNEELFSFYQKYMDAESELRETIRNLVRDIEQLYKEGAIRLQIMHCDLNKIPDACVYARRKLSLCSEKFKELATLIPEGQYYRYSDHWTYTTQRLIYLIALIYYLESGKLVTREEAAKLLELQTSYHCGFHLDVEDYLHGILQLASELSRFATNSVTMGDYERPLHISQFMVELNTGFRMLSLKNDSLRKRFDALKYDVKKIEEVVYDITVRGLIKQAVPIENPVN